MQLAKPRLRLRPHTKTHKIPDLGRMQLSLGAAGLTVAKVMIPRHKVVALPRTATVDDVRAIVAQKGHTRMPVYDGSLDSVDPNPLDPGGRIAKCGGDCSMTLSSTTPNTSNNMFGDGCNDTDESAGLFAAWPASKDQWMFYDVPVPALFSAPSPKTTFRTAGLLSAGIAVMRLLAYGEKHRSDGVTESFLITEELEGYSDLESYLKQNYSQRSPQNRLSLRRLAHSCSDRKRLPVGNFPSLISATIMSANCWYLGRGLLAITCVFIALLACTHVRTS